jgi:integrase
VTKVAETKRKAISRNRTAAPRRDPKTGAWYFVVDVGFAADGKRRQAYRRGFKTKAEAQKALDELRGTVRQGAFIALARRTLGDFLIDDWLPAVRTTLAESTWESYQRNIRNHVEPRLGRVRLQRLDGGMLNRFYADLLDSGRMRGQQSPGLKPRTVRYIHTIIHAALDDAVRWSHLAVNAADQANPPAASQAKPPEMRIWTGAQVARFLDLTDGDRYQCSWLFLVTTGCRRGEALGLRWLDVDLDRPTAAIRQECIPLTKPSGRGREGRIIQRTKADRPRVIELDTETVGALRTWRARQAEERLLMGAGYQDRGLVFCRPDGRLYHPEAFSKAFERRLRQTAFAELPTIRLHDLRHTWATLALIAGVDVKIVSERLGHSSPMITWQTYQHVVQGMQSDAAERVAALIFGGRARDRR